MLRSVRKNHLLPPRGARHLMTFAAKEEGMGGWVCVGGYLSIRHQPGTAREETTAMERCYLSLNNGRTRENLPSHSAPATNPTSLRERPLLEEKREERPGRYTRTGRKRPFARPSGEGTGALLPAAAPGAASGGRGARNRQGERAIGAAAEAGVGAGQKEVLPGGSAAGRDHAEASRARAGPSWAELRWAVR